MLSKAKGVMLKLPITARIFEKVIPHFAPCFGGPLPFCLLACFTDTYPDLRQCLIYDSHEKDARLIGVEYMVPRHVYETFQTEEQTLWHSHEYEVKSGMLILPKPADYDVEEWEKAELEAMKEIVGLYGKTWHF